MQGVISVVIPIYDVEPYLHACLRSVAQQTYRDLQVVMVDDGSTDASAAIAEQFAADDPRFQLVRQANSGLGAARNAGLAEATGEFLAFVDSDDLLPHDAYALLAGRLQRSGSDLATGVVRRFGTGGTARSDLTPFDAGVSATHVTRTPALLADRIVTNKVWRRSFWDQHDLHFPPGVLYEDILVALSAQVLAESVDVLRETVYWWRRRTAGAPSITQRRGLSQGIRDRVAAVRRVGELMREHGMPDLERRYQRVALTDELRRFVLAADEADPAYRDVLVSDVGGYVRDVDPRVVTSLPAFDRLLYHLLAQGRIEQLLEVVEFGRDELADARTVRRRGARYLALPFFDQPEAGVPREVYRLEADVQARASVQRLQWRNRKLHIEGFAYLDRVAAPRTRDVRTRLIIRDVETGRDAVVPAHQRREPLATAAAEQATNSYDGCGFAAVVDPRLLFPDAVTERTVEVHVEVEVDGVRRRTGRWDASWDLVRDVDVEWIRHATYVRVGLDGGGLQLTVERRLAVVDELTCDGDTFTLSGPLRIGRLRVRGMTVRRRGSEAAARLPLDADPPRRERRWSARLPVTAFAATSEAADDEPFAAERRGDGVIWMVRLRLSDGSEVPVTARSSLSEAIVPTGTREFVARRSRNGRLTVVERDPHPTVTSLTWGAGASLQLALTSTQPGPGAVRLRHRLSRAEHSVPVDEVGDALVTLPLGSMDAPGGDRPLAGGAWDVVGIIGSDERQVPVKIATGVSRVLPITTADKGRAYTAEAYGFDSLAVTVSALPAYSRQDAQRLRGRRYQRGRLSRPKDAVVFESWRGRKAGGDVRALHDRLRDTGGPPSLWVVDDDRVEVPGATTVRRGSPEHAEALATARWVVTDHLLPRWWQPRRGQRVLQTWHGIPVKRSGFSLRPEQAVAVPRLLRELRRQSQAWDLLLSPTPAATELLRTTLDFRGDVVEGCAPRWDSYTDAGQAQQRRDAVRRHLSVPSGARVVLWAPTSRYEGWTGRRRQPLGVDLDLGGLEDHVLLLHGHPWSTTQPAVPGWHDVSAHPDVYALLPAADVVVTDYSSLALDAVHTNATLLLFTPDLSRMREAPGLAIDLPALVPEVVCDQAAGVARTLHRGTRLPEDQSVRERLRVWAGIANGRTAETGLRRLFD
ncbi:MAG TPA: CDP-glycerol glycerophosphotransferase family protein [Egibacteraceae bacterium]|nr:CDP-glycerol glycerophosphotransferase family protein [Egibacteraceae bacterium]